MMDFVLVLGMSLVHGKTSETKQLIPVHFYVLIWCFYLYMQLDVGLRYQTLALGDLHQTIVLKIGHRQTLSRFTES